MGGARQSWADVVVYLVLVSFTAMEISLVHLDVERALRIMALAGLAMAKGGAVLLFFMRLRVESATLRFIAAVPIALAPLFAVVLMLDAVYRLVGAR
ncbi:MAG TPA: cytochrome C oxidase subunit IV family protein [Polyangia bacterium]|jgi:caa(3)-type oxidase subunit IV|nr:cytochrome C oxidase subunit IV family protein [Polyangia bacterium]